MLFGINKYLSVSFEILRSQTNFRKHYDAHKFLYFSSLYSEDFSNASLLNAVSITRSCIIYLWKFFRKKFISRKFKKCFRENVQRNLIFLQFVRFLLFFVA